MKMNDFLGAATAAFLLCAAAPAQDKPAETPAAKEAKPAEAKPAEAKPSGPVPAIPKSPPKPRVVQLWGEIDKDGDNKASYDDIKKSIPDYPLERFNALDLNRDKSLSKDELPRSGGARRPAPPGGPRPGGGQPGAEMIAILQQADADKDMKVTAEEFKSAIPTAPEGRFKELDKNSDGVLDKNDQPLRPDPRGNHRRADENKDGKVTREEYAKAFPKAPPERFTKLDRNNDGALDDADTPPPPAITRPPGSMPKSWEAMIANLLEDHDKDKDGKITFEEFSGGKAEMPRKTFDKFDTNKDSFISQDDKKPDTQSNILGNVKVSAPGDSKERFKKADKNGDGKLDYAEASAEYKNMTEDQFKKRDVNGDGFLGPEDRAARKPAAPPAAAASASPAAPAPAALVPAPAAETKP